LPVDPLKVRGVSQACSLTPRQRSNSEPLPPAAAAGSEDPAPPDRTHAPAKAVRFGSFSTVGLIGALHENSLLALWTARTVAQSISEARVAIQRPGARGLPPRKRAGQGSCGDRSGENCWKAGTSSMRWGALKFASQRSRAERRPAAPRAAGLFTLLSTGCG
jgi:hypothetical protein